MGKYETTVWRIRNALLLKVGQHALGDITSYCIYITLAAII